LGINSGLFEGSKGSSLIGFRGALFFCFFSFGRAKEKKKGRVKTNDKKLEYRDFKFMRSKWVVQYFLS
jgi:hypothetical protein